MCAFPGVKNDLQAAREAEVELNASVPNPKLRAVGCTRMRLRANVGRGPAIAQVAAALVGTAMTCSLEEDPPRYYLAIYRKRGE